MNVRVANSVEMVGNQSLGLNPATFVFRNGVLKISEMAEFYRARGGNFTMQDQRTLEFILGLDGCTLKAFFEQITKRERKDKGTELREVGAGGALLA